MTDYHSTANSVTLYLIVGAVLCFVVAISLVFIIRAYREGLRIGMKKEVLRKTVVSSVTFTIVPSVGILLGVIALAGQIGSIPVPWLRLSVIGALQYESQSADLAIRGLGYADGFSTAGLAMNGSILSTVAFVMTVGIIWGMILCVLTLRGYSKRIKKFNKGGANRWGTIMFNSLFIGMVSAYVGIYLSRVTTGDFLPLLAMITSAAVMWIITVIIKKFKQDWLENFALSVSMLAGMAVAVLVG